MVEKITSGTQGICTMLRFYRTSRARSTIFWRFGDNSSSQLNRSTACDGTRRPWRPRAPSAIHFKLEKNVVSNVTTQLESVNITCLNYKILLPEGHIPQLSLEVSMLSPLHDPSFCSCDCILRILVLIPVPHVILQVDHEDHDSHSQLTDLKNRTTVFIMAINNWRYRFWMRLVCFYDLPEEHVPELQLCCSVERPLHPIPPFSSWASTFLVLTWTPSPQVVLQLAHASHEPHTQFTKNSWQ